MSKDLNKLRSKIDTTDQKIIKLLEKRFSLTKKVAISKLRSREPVLQPERWQQVLSRLQLESNKRNLSFDMLKDIWDSIHEHSKVQQNNIHHDSKKE
ncbi:MAG: Chorismate mutase protein [Patescibacteria group bacterium]|nr:Chorismate mutase protein [Patescibacteria group bacterium]